MSLGLRHGEPAADEAPPRAADPAPADGRTAIWRRPGPPPVDGQTAIWRREGPPRPRRGRGPTALLILSLVAVGVAFEIVYGQAPLFTGNQHTYVLHGLGQAGAGLLENDWMASTADPAPVSSLLVQFAAESGAQWLLLLFHALLIGAYGIALFGIGVTLLRLRGLAVRLAFLAALLFVHSWLANRLQLGLPDDLRSLITKGVAGQYAPGLTFQPSLFGVLLVASLLAYARGRPLAAILSAGAAAIFHPTYLLAALVLSAAYLADTYFRTGDRLLVARGAALAAAVAAPVAIYALVAFPPASPELHQAAQNTLVNFRIPHHAQPAVWFARDDALRLGLIAAGLALAWRSVLFPVLALAVAAGAFLTALQLITANDTLALLFPWRVSVFLVPVSAALVLAALTRVVFAAAGGVGGWLGARFVDGGAERVAGGGRALACGLAGLVIAVSLVVGSERIGRLEAEPRQTAFAELAASSIAPGDMLLVPPRAYELRIETGAPVYVDYKTHPYEDREVLEWRRRLREATRVYSGDSLSCSSLEPLVRRAGLTHVVAELETRVRCSFLRRGLGSDGYVVYTVERPRRARL